MERRLGIDSSAALTKTIVHLIPILSRPIPSHMKVGRWHPQPALLAHPSLRLFVSHVGAKSWFSAPDGSTSHLTRLDSPGMREAACSGVAVLPLPFFADQARNAWLLQDRGTAAPSLRKHSLKCPSSSADQSEPE